MIGSRLSAIALLGALLFAQALGMAHAFDHPALGQADHVCAVCLHGQGLDDVLPAGQAAFPVPAHEPLRRAAELAVIPLTDTALGYRSRAPPIRI